MIDYFSADLELKSVSVGQRLISGYAAHHHSVDRVRDIIDPVASAKAVARLKSPQEVGVFIGHNAAGLPVGIPQVIEATPQGLYTETYILKGAEGDNLLAKAKDLMDHGQSLGMSIGYRMHDSAIEQTAHGRVRRLLDYALKEYSYASSQAIANPQALVTAVKSRRRAATHTKAQEGTMQYRVDQQGERWVVLADTDGDGDADDNLLIGTYPSADIAGAVADALRRYDQDAGDDDAAAGAGDADEAQQGAPDKTAHRGLATKAEWTQRMINDLPDSAFLFIADGGATDEDGKTVPRSNRHLPYRGPDGAVDLPHLRNAIARIPQSDLPAEVKTRLQARARRMLAQAEGGKTVDDEAPEWKCGAAPALYGLAWRLIDLSEQVAEEHKAMTRLGEETKGYQRIRAQTREALRAVTTDVSRLLDHAETIDRGEDGKQRLAWFKQQLALTEV